MASISLNLSCFPIGASVSGKARSLFGLGTVLSNGKSRCSA